MSSPLLADIQRYARSNRPPGCVSAARIVLRHYGLHALVAYRLGRFLLSQAGRLYWWPVLPIAWPLYFLIRSYVQIVYDIKLSLSANIGPGLHISHFGGIVVRGCKIGANCSIAQLVEITPWRGTCGPIIGDRVWIGAHCKIKGQFVIGSDSTLSSGAVIERNIPERTLCLGAPARIIMPGYDNRHIL